MCECVFYKLDLNQQGKHIKGMGYLLKTIHGHRHLPVALLVYPLCYIWCFDFVEQHYLEPNLCVLLLPPKKCKLSLNYSSCW